MNSVKTGFDDYDEIFGELSGGQLIVIGGRPAMGKSTFAMNIVHNVCMDKSKSVLVFSLEKEGYHYINRLISLNPRDKVSEWKLDIDDTSGITVEYIDNKISSMKHISMVVIDYLQLVSVSEAEADLSYSGEVIHILRDLKMLAEKYGMPVIVLSQLSRDCEKRDDHRPVISDISRSKKAKEIPDIIIMLYRDGYYRRVDVQDDQTAEIIIVKHPSVEELPRTIEMTYNAVAGGFSNRTRK